MTLAAESGADIISTPAIGAISRLRQSEIIRKQIKNAAEADLFQEVIFNDGQTIRAAINSGRKTFDEFLDLLERAESFKKWIVGVKPDQKLIAQYYREIKSESWLDKLPTKAVRFFVFAGLGALVDVVVPTGLGTAGGLALGATDTFLLDKILKGWSPNQFVQNELENFVNLKD